MEYSLKINEFMKSVNVQFDKKDVAGFKASIAYVYIFIHVFGSFYILD
jgi:hypothetical protein